MDAWDAIAAVAAVVGSAVGIYAVQRERGKEAPVVELRRDAKDSFVLRVTNRGAAQLRVHTLTVEQPKGTLISRPGLHPRHEASLMVGGLMTVESGKMREVRLLLSFPDEAARTVELRFVTSALNRDTIHRVETEIT